ncbi:MAG: RDD family protein [Nitratireductor sp.]
MAGENDSKTYDYEDLSGSNVKSTRSIYFEQLDGVRSRRVMAYIFDYALVFGLAAIFGIVTLGFGFLIFGALAPLIAVVYIWLTLGGEKQATLGMQFFAIKLIRLDGGKVDGLLAVLHSIVFWVAHVMLTPIILIVSLFSSKKRLVQDILLGTVVVRSDQ